MVGGGGMISTELLDAVLKENRCPATPSYPYGRVPPALAPRENIHFLINASVSLLVQP